MKFRALLIGILLLAVTVGCNQVPEAEPVMIVSETDSTRTIAHTFGTTEIPKAPQRVVALGEEGLLADLLDIGIQPVASIVNIPEDVPLISAEETANTDLVRSSGNVSLEKLVAYEPDLIIGNVFFIDRAGYGRLSDIAPTVAVRFDDPLLAYIETLTIFGMQEQAEADVAAFEAQIASEAERLNTDSVEVSVVAIYSGSNVALFFDGPQPPPGLLSELGVTMLPVEAERDDLRIRNGRAFISEERLDLITGEKIILLQSSSVDGELEAIEEMAENPIWRQLTAVQNDQLYPIDRIGYPGFRGQQQLLTDLVAILE